MIYAVRDTQGRLLAGDARLAAVAMNGDTGQLVALTQLDQRRVRSLTTRFDTSGGVTLITVADLRPVAEPAARYGFISTLLWDFVQLDVTLVLVWVGISLGLRPVKRLRDEIAARSPQGSAAHRRILCAAGNRARGRHPEPLVRYAARLGAVPAQFIANTAHQLRTPITGLQAQLDLLVAEAAAAPVHSRLVTLQEGIRQLAHSANQLLALARADPTVNLATKNKTVALELSVGEVVSRFFDRALKSNIDLGADVAPAAVMADPSLIDDLLSNLVDNALKYTPAGGPRHRERRPHPRPRLHRGGGHRPRHPEAERQRVRQRFYRLPNSPGHGSGLGLAIVDEIAQIYGAAFTLDAGAQGAGVRARVLFP